jgi:Na+/melibiose symporter-like transporter
LAGTRHRPSGLGHCRAGVDTQSPDTILAKRWGMPGLSLVALAVFLVAMRFCPLGTTQVEAVHVKLEALHQQKAAQLANET